MDDDKRLEDDQADGLEPDDSSLAGAVDNATSEELVADPSRTEDADTRPAAEDPAVVRARELGTTGPKLS